MITRRDFLPAVLTGATADPTKTWTDADRLGQLRKMYGDDAVLDALQESVGAVKGARTILSREKQRRVSGEDLIIRPKPVLQ